MTDGALWELREQTFALERGAAGGHGRRSSSESEPCRIALADGSRSAAAAGSLALGQIEIGRRDYRDRVPSVDFDELR